MFQLREINQMEREMYQYLDWEPNIELGTLKELNSRTWFAKISLAQGHIPLMYFKPSRSSPQHPPTTPSPPSRSTIQPLLFLTSSPCLPLEHVSGPHCWSAWGLEAINNHNWITSTFLNACLVTSVRTRVWTSLWMIRWWVRIGMSQWIFFYIQIRCVCSFSKYSQLTCSWFPYPNFITLHSEIFTLCSSLCPRLLYALS